MLLPGQVMQLTGAGARGSRLASLPWKGSTYGSWPYVMVVVSPCLPGPQNKLLGSVCVKTCIS